MSHLDVLKNPNKELRVKSRDVSVEDILSSNMQALVDNMIETMVAENGVGLAAPQVNEHVRLIVCDTGHKTEAFFNPVIIKTSNRSIDSEEGCLSIPDVYGIVKRHKSVKVEAFNRAGKPVTIKTGGLLAIIFQHEIDHLNGVLFIDRAHKIDQITPEKAESLI